MVRKLKEQISVMLDEEKKMLLKKDIDRVLEDLEMM